MNATDAKPRILIVDDSLQGVEELTSMLKDDYELSTTADGREAIRLAGAQPKPDLILIAVPLPGVDSLDVCGRIKNTPATTDATVILVSSKRTPEEEARGFELGASDFVSKPLSAPVVKARVRTHLALRDQKRLLANEIEAQTEQLRRSRLGLIQRFGRAAEYMDSESGRHVVRMSQYARLIAEATGRKPDWVELLFQAAPLNDIGKIGIPERIRNKPGKLTQDEWKVMRSHTLIGAKIIGDEPDPLLQMARSIALTHHEKWNGTGYPEGLKGEEIPLEGRIVAIADVFDALTSPRPYKRSWTIYDSVELIREHAGSHFDPGLVELFDKVLPEILRIREKYTDK